MSAVNGAVHGAARVNVLGVGVSAIAFDEALDILDGWIQNGDRRYVCVTGVHGVMESQSDAELRDIHNRAGLVTPDGMPLVWVGRACGHKHVERVYGPDLMLAVCALSVERGYRHYLYGGAEGVPERLAASLTARFPGLNVVGMYSPPFRALTPEEDAAIVQAVNDTHPHFVWVGLSTPKQERWMSEHVGRLDVPVLLGVGAAFDFHSGLKPQAPRWMQRSGLEWFFRLATEPRRLGPRYLVNNPKFVWNILLQSLRLRRYTLT